MKTMYQKLLFLLLMLPLSMLAQSTLTGVVRDNTTGEPIPGVNVIVQGTPNGTATDLDGKYTLGNVKSGDKLVFSSIGFSNQVIDYAGQATLDVSLAEDATQLQEVVVIGYGTTTKKDATGAISTVTSKDFNKGAISSADQLLTGRSPGVRITSAGGQPDAAPNIRIRGGSSLSAQNNPLIVIDNVPIDFVNPAGVSNPLSLVNPNDIESFTILKDASATAIYGSRASNGVIIITTKKGASGAPQFNYSSNISFGKVTKDLDVMDGPTFTRFVQQYYPQYTNLLGVPDTNALPGTLDNPLTPNVIEGRILSNTNWQDAIYRTSIFTDHSFSARANLFKKVPFRASVGYTKNDGVVKTNDYERYSASLKFTPTFFDDHLKIDINAKGLRSQKNTVDEGGAIGGAANMDPTKPIYANNNFGGYYQNVTNANPQDFDGQYNPLNLLEQRRRPENVDKLLANAQIDYKMHFLPELRAIVNVGIEGSRAEITERFYDYAFASYQLSNNPVAGDHRFNPGVNFRENQHITNKTLDTYLAYNKTFDGIITRIDAQAGHSYQSFVNDGYKEEYRYIERDVAERGQRELIFNAQNPNNRYYNKTALESYFGRANVDLFDKYLFTFTMRADGSSLFRKDNRWGYFPAVGFAWRAIDENFLKGGKTLSDLKVRLGYGQTGQQDITQIAGYYPTSALFSNGSVSSQYLPGSFTYSANPFNDQLKWEVTTTYNAGVDFAFFENEILSGSVDVYRRDTKDLLVKAFVPPGQYLTNEITQNVGELTNKGIELNLKAKLVTTEDFTWDVLGNISFNEGEVTNLNNVTSIEASESGLPVQTGLKIARHAVGYQPYSAYVFEQLYDANGQPVVGAFKDRNGDGTITNDDKYYVSLRPNWTYGFSTNVTYKNIDLSATFHGQLDGKVYNAIKLAGGNRQRVIPNNTNSLSNALNFYNGSADPNFENVQGNIPSSDYFLEDASFLRCDNITLGYRISNVTKTGSLRLYAGVNNAFIIKSYSGNDPENFNAIDNNFYPRPRMYNFGVNFDF